MRIIAFVASSADIRHITGARRAVTEPPRIAAARGPPDAQVGERMESVPDWDAAVIAISVFEVYQRISR